MGEGKGGRWREGGRGKGRKRERRREREREEEREKVGEGKEYLEVKEREKGRRGAGLAKWVRHLPVVSRVNGSSPMPKDFSKM